MDSSVAQVAYVRNLVRSECSALECSFVIKMMVGVIDSEQHNNEVSRYWSVLTRLILLLLRPLDLKNLFHVTQR
jgi:hypothetical protein